MDLHGKVALVTGGAVRVGKAIALAFADAGADIAFSYNSSAEAAAATAAEIEAKGRRVLSIRADQSEAAQVTALVDAAVGQFGRLDVLVNSASLWRRTPWVELDEEAWDQLLDINLKGPFLCAKAAAPHWPRTATARSQHRRSVGGRAVPEPYAALGGQGRAVEPDPGVGDGAGPGGAGERDRARPRAAAARIH